LLVRFFKELFLGVSTYWETILFIKKHKLYWLVVFPLIIMLGIYKLGEVIQFHSFYKETGTMNEIVWYMLIMFLEISMALIFMNFTKYLMVALLSPLLTYLSQKTEKIVTKNNYHYTFFQLKNDIKRAIKLVFRNLLWYYLWFLVIYTLSLLFFKNPTSNPLFFLTYVVLSYYYGFGFIDYVNERRKLNVQDSILFIRHHSGLALGIGGVYSCMILLPVDLNVLFGQNMKDGIYLQNTSSFLFQVLCWLLASFGPILATVNATLTMNKLIGLKK
jgi:CysZ protein